jgi:hypothetical protein
MEQVDGQMAVQSWVAGIEFGVRVVQLLLGEFGGSR